MNDTSLRRRAERWRDADPEPLMQAELSRKLASGDEDSLRACFEPELAFGTAGLRGIVGPGPAGMNLAVILRVTRALAEQLLASGLDRSRPVVVGFDARLDSARFAEAAVGVLAAAGLRVAFFVEPVPTPLVAFVALARHALAGIVVTASHNPPEYNGYKVYGDSAIQLIAPVDIEIAARISGVGDAVSIPRVAQAFSATHGLLERLGEPEMEAYVAAVLATRGAGAPARPIRMAYSPLHGVGAALLTRLMRSAGHAAPLIEPSQAMPDGRFPTLRFPNPEEPGVLQLTLDLAKASQAELVLANDPDADRLAVAIPDQQNGWRVLSGNEIGVILTDHRLRTVKRDRPALVVSTVVSTPMTERLALARGAHFEPTLTGFKWLWTAARQLSDERGWCPVIAFEEALGYSTHPAVRDKDGIAAALHFADWVADCQRVGEAPIARLSSLLREFGAWVSHPQSVTLVGAEGAQRISDALERLGSAPPSEVGGRRLLRMLDYRVGAAERPPWLGESPLLQLELAGDIRLLLRPSGTEPKLKLYAYGVEAVGDDQSPFDVMLRVEAEVARIGSALLRWLEL